MRSRNSILKTRCKKSPGVGTTDQKRRFIRDHLREFGSVSKGCQVMGISRTTFYRRPTREEKKMESDLWLRAEIEKIHEELPGYGYRRIKQHLLRLGKTVNGKKIRRVMREFEIYSCRQKRTKPRGGAIGKKLVHPNLIRGLKLTAPNQVWATDITFIRLVREYICLSAIIDIYTRKIVGWAIGKTIDHRFIIEALRVQSKTRSRPEA